MGDTYKAWGSEYLILSDPMFLSRTVADECELFCSDQVELAHAHWSQLSSKICLGKQITDPVDEFSSGERVAAALLVVAAIAHAKGNRLVKVLLDSVDSSLSAQRREDIRTAMAVLDHPLAVYYLDEELGPKPW